LSTFTRWRRPARSRGDSPVEAHFAQEHYDISITELLSGVAGHDSYLSTVAARLMLDESYVATEACCAYASTRGDNEFICTAGFSDNI
jgi:hypothetical protein